MNHNEKDSREEASIGRLIHAAGRGPTPSSEARTRIYYAVQAEWRKHAATPEGRRNQDRPALPGRRFWLLRALPAAVAIGLAAVAVQIARSPIPAPGVELASLSRVVGDVTVEATGSALRAAAAMAALGSGDTLQTASDGAAALRLTNGIELRVAASSQLRLVSSDRVELVRGLVYLDSGPGGAGSAPLELVTPFGSVAHVGTQYETRVGSNNLRIRVREGAVRFARETDDTTATAIRADAGEELLLLADEDLRRNRIAINGPDWAWVERLAAAPAGDTHGLDELLTWIARETGRELSYASDELAARARVQTIVGASGLTPNEAAAVVAGTTGLRVELADGTLLVR